MNSFHNLIIEPLSKSHDKSGFKCGIESLDNYLRRQAGQDVKRHISRIYAAVPVKTQTKIVGYYSLSSLSIELNQLPENLLQKLPKYPIPAALIGRLAVDKAAQGNGVGKMLLADAIKRTIAVREEIAIYAMVVDAINDEAKTIYQRFGFKPFSKETHRLFLPLKSISFYETSKTRTSNIERPTPNIK